MLRPFGLGVGGHLLWISAADDLLVPNRR